MAFRLWVVTELYYPEATSTGRFLTGMAESLASDFEVHVICSQPTYSARGLTAPRHEDRGGVAIERCTTSTLNKDILPLRIVNALTISCALAFRLVRRSRPGDAVLVVTNPPLLPYVVALAARLRRAYPVLLVHDVYPDTLIAAGLMEERALLIRVWNWLNRAVYPWYSRIVVLGRDMKNRLIRRHMVIADRLEIIPNWGELDQVQPIPAELSHHRRDMGLSEKFVVQYMGNMGRTHAFDGLIEVADRLRQDTFLHFEYIGWGSARDSIADEVGRRALSNVTVLPPVPQSELSDTLAAADLAVITLKPGMKGISVPSRLYNVMAAGRPILAIMEPEAEASCVVREERIGWVVHPSDHAAIEGAIQEARSRPEVLSEMGALARRAAEDRYSIAAAAELYRKVLNRCFRQGEP